MPDPTRKLQTIDATMPLSDATGLADSLKKQPGALFIVPAYNEEQNVDSVIDDLCCVTGVEHILIVNDGSKDKTADIARARHVNVIDFPVNLGVAAAVMAGFRFAVRNGYDLAVQFDGDGQHIACEADKVLEPVSKGVADISIGCRNPQNDQSTTFARKSGSKAISAFLSLTTGQKLQDPTSGFRAYSKKAILRFCEIFPDEYPEVESIVLAKKFGLAIGEVRVEMRPRSAGRSSITTMGAFYYMIKVILASLVVLLRRE